MSKALRDKVILVTGGGTGIGRGIAYACVEAGAKVVVGTLEDMSSEASDTESMSSIDYQQLDVADPKAIAQWVENAAQKHGRIDGLVANAGVTVVSDFLDVELAELERLWSINQRGVFLTAQAVAKDMVKRTTAGSIVTIGSNHAKASAAGYEMYAATKAGIVAMSRAMAWSLGKHGIRVNSLSPGLTRTEAVMKHLHEAPHLDSAFRSLHASGRYNSVDEVGSCAVFLLSSASASMTGADLLADHGMSAALAEFPGA